MTVTVRFLGTGNAFADGGRSHACIGIEAPGASLLFDCGGSSLPAIKKAMIEKHVKLIGKAADRKAKILCLQELFYGPYFCAEQETKWYHLTERVPDLGIADLPFLFPDTVAARAAMEDKCCWP